MPTCLWSVYTKLHVHTKQQDLKWHKMKTRWVICLWWKCLLLRSVSFKILFPDKTDTIRLWKLFLRPLAGWNGLYAPTFTTRVVTFHYYFRWMWKCIERVLPRNEVRLWWGSTSIGTTPPTSCMAHSTTLYQRTSLWHNRLVTWMLLMRIRWANILYIHWLMSAKACIISLELRAKVWNSGGYRIRRFLLGMRVTEFGNWLCVKMNFIFLSF